MGDVATVRSTALERKVLHRIAPHLAEPQWLVVPARSRAGLLKFRAAVTAYEKLGEVEEADLHRNLSGSALAEAEPLLDRRLHPYACVYREYVTDDARLVVANLRAAAGQGAQPLARAPVKRILVQDGRAVGVEAECTESGRRFAVRATCVINAAGPWVDAVRALEDGAAPPRLHLSKGVHVVVRRERLPLRNILILGTLDRRSIFALPRGGSVYVGTTDTSYAPGYETWPKIEAADVEYLLEPLGRYLRVEPLGFEDVFSAWAGLRPLIAQAGKAPTEISRKDEVWVGPAGVVTVAGGKLTGYRPMARSSVAHAAETTGLSLDDAPETPALLPGAEGAHDLEALSIALAKQFGLSSAIAESLARGYGGEAPAVLDCGAQPVAEGVLLVRGQIDWAVRYEDARHLEDVLYRRTGTAFYDPVGRQAAVVPVAKRMAELLGWSEAEREAEVAGVERQLAADLAFKQRSNSGGEKRVSQELRA
jgi:glycerol-3-phosphate dehydrogenase